MAVFTALAACLLSTSYLLQADRGDGPAAAGLDILPLAMTATIAAVVCGRRVAARAPRTPLLTAGIALSLAGLALVVLPLHAGVLTASLAVLGAGIGLAKAPITAIAVSSLPLDRAGAAGGITSTARQIGAALGTALAGVATTAGAPAATASTWVLITLAGLAITLLVGTLLPRQRPA